jgi:hypothetical protein
MIAKQMKSKTASDRDPSLFARLQWFLAVIGIVTAIACSLVLLEEIQPVTDEVKQSYKVSASSSFGTRQITSVKTLSIFSILAKL